MFFIKSLRVLKQVSETGNGFIQTGNGLISPTS
jgi:hypothetical protein